MQFKKTFIKSGEGVEILFRPPKAGDAKAAMQFINKFVDEKSYVAMQEKITLTNEKKWLRATMKKIRKKETISIFAFLNNKKIIGSCGVEKGGKTSYHTGVIGIAIAKDFRGIGLGKFMMQYMIKEAQQKLKSEIVVLHVYSQNKPAQVLYKKLGFRVAGRVPKGIKHHGKYMDDIIMYKNLRKT